MSKEFISHLLTCKFCLVCEATARNVWAVFGGLQTAVLHGEPVALEGEIFLYEAAMDRYKIGAPPEKQLVTAV